MSTAFYRSSQAQVVQAPAHIPVVSICDGYGYPPAELQQAPEDRHTFRVGFDMGAGHYTADVEQVQALVTFLKGHIDRGTPDVIFHCNEGRIRSATLVETLLMYFMDQGEDMGFGGFWPRGFDAPPAALCRKFMRSLRAGLDAMEEPTHG